MDDELILLNFNEAPLNFPPTYKFEVGTDAYITRFVHATHARCYNFNIMMDQQGMTLSF